jgi:hypothetical protein
MPCDNFTTLSMNVTGTGLFRSYAKRVAVFLVARFIVVLVSAGYRTPFSFREDRTGTSSEYPGIHTGTKSSRGRDVSTLHVDARRVSPAIFPYTWPGHNPL